ncbi:RagB/SusD family nutrient uptake outer membrane protein [Pseudobacter ginsenosidimutans]|uniref:SusD-like starch-binding protein associating with outer membrane n=1 Tax=Pseudobacter ginsenosidimutans TaxID=661488 RepID=A0A4V2F1Z9_9BACT|nr:RagB/SusD family nutrient uptake outer membrane protein [Pseudobacter ginsenosidimutans]QEC44095.1 RagB/SusD family nutrient uptake outer membrane protein [Pseudobacter ginsenosidimutans]RZS75536.1 SusD-like starch-binding protein associating with outer membrane [Pseudobacter ginsenosidimutans]
MRISIIFLFLAGIHFSSCKKFLEERTQSEMTPVSTEDYSQLLFGTSYPRGGTVLMPGVTLMSDDMQYYAHQIDHDYEAKTGYPAFTWQYNFDDLARTSGLTNPFKDSWTVLYNHITGCNIAIDATPESKGTASEKDQLMGEAYALRAFLYWHLVNLYSRPFNDSTTTPDKLPGVPLLISADLRNELPARSTVAEVYTKIRKDIEQAVTYFSVDKRKDNLHRFNYPAAHLLASRIYLYTEEWEKVIEHATASIAVQPLVLDLNDWPADYYYDESMYRPIHAQKNQETLFLYGTASEMRTGADFVAGMSEDLASKFEANDLRATIYFSPLPEFMLMFTPLKYGTQKRDIKVNAVENATSLRTSEAYLNRAEAYAQLYATKNNPADAQRALDDLNFIRQRRFSPANFQPVTMMPAAELLQFCRDERRREFFEENQRWFDLRRYGMPEIIHIYALFAEVQRFKLSKGDPAYTLLIPTEAIRLNPRLEQNPAAPPRNPFY